MAAFIFYNTVFQLEILDLKPETFHCINTEQKLYRKRTLYQFCFP